MSMRGRFKLEPTHRERPIPQSLADVADLDLWATGEERPYTLDRNREWSLRASMEVRFWANDAQLREATKIAKRVLAQRIYADVLSEFSRIRLALAGHDIDEALKSMDRIEQFLADGV